MSGCYSCGLFGARQLLIESLNYWTGVKHSEPPPNLRGLFAFRVQFFLNSVFEYNVPANQPCLIPVARARQCPYHKQTDRKRQCEQRVPMLYSKMYCFIQLFHIPSCPAQPAGLFYWISLLGPVSGSASTFTIDHVTFVASSGVGNFTLISTDWPGINAS